MLLAIDIGNTNIVFGIHKENKWVDHWRIKTDHLKTADEYKVIFLSLMSASGFSQPSIKSIILSSVVPSLVRPFTEMLNCLFSEAKTTLVKPEIYPKLPVNIMNPYEIGADLVANSIAAYQEYGDNTMIIDFGTALTFTTIGKAEIRGVSIVPGLKTAVKALAGGTAQLPEIHLTTPPSVLGENSVHAIQSGIIFGYTGLVNSIVEHTEKEMKTKLNVVATGGLSSVISPLTDRIQYIKPMLTLDGLVKIESFIAK